MRAQDFDLLLLAVDDIAQLAQRIILISEFDLDLLKTLVAHVGSLPGWCCGCSALVEFFVHRRPWASRTLPHALIDRSKKAFQLLLTAGSSAWSVGSLIASSALGMTACSSNGVTIRDWSQRSIDVHCAMSLRTR